MKAVKGNAYSRLTRVRRVTVYTFLTCHARESPRHAQFYNLRPSPRPSPRLRRHATTPRHVFVEPPTNYETSSHHYHQRPFRLLRIAEWRWRHFLLEIFWLHSQGLKNRLRGREWRYISQRRGRWQSWILRHSSVSVETHRATTNSSDMYACTAVMMAMALALLVAMETRGAPTSSREDEEFNNVVVSQLFNCDIYV